LRLAAIVPSSSLWQRFQQYFLSYSDLNLSIDISRMKFPDDFFEKMAPRIEKAFAAMRELESGAIANPDEQRMVGHYWLRNPAVAPTAEIRSEIEETIQRIKNFAADVHAGKIAATKLLELQKQVRPKLSTGSAKTAEEIARSIDADPEEVSPLLRHLASNDPHVRIATGEQRVDDRFSVGN
jgi:glucose-6-phosphate isomerase